MLYTVGFIVIKNFLTRLSHRAKIAQKLLSSLPYSRIFCNKMRIFPIQHIEISQTQTAIDKKIIALLYIYLPTQLMHHSQRHHNAVILLGGM